QRYNYKLSETVRELPTIDGSDDTDTRFQPPRNNYNQKQSLYEGYRLANSQKVLKRHKRDDATLVVGSSQTTPMDGTDSVTKEEDKHQEHLYYYKCFKNK